MQNIHAHIHKYRASQVVPEIKNHNPHPMQNILAHIHKYRASQVVPEIKNLPANAEDVREAGSTLGLGRSPWRRKWQPTPVFLPEESHGQRSLAGYSP